VLFKRMLLPNNSQVSARFGVKPLCEADLVVVVQDKGINRARTIKEAAEHLSEVVAFIELPDSFLSTNQPVTGAMLAAANVGARFGVLGDRTLIRTSPAFLDALSGMRITMTDQTGAVLGQGQGKDMLGHPLHAVLWLKDELRRAGQTLMPGDLISLGGVHMIQPQPGQTITVTYEGLPGDPLKASVSFY
jgi:2-keto-4-pentenoate hydratase